MERPLSIGFWPTLIIVFGAISGYLVLALKMEYHQVLNEWAVRQSSIADDRARLVANWIRERRLDAESDSQAPEVLTYLSSMAASGDAHGHNSHNLLSHLALLNQIKDSYGYLGTYVLDAQSHVVLEAIGSRDPASQVFSGTDKALATGQLQIEWLPDGPAWGTLCIISPVVSRNDSGHRLGAVALVIRLTDSLFPLLTHETVPTRTGETLLVDRTPGQILYRSPLREARSGGYSYADDPTLAAHAALQGKHLFGGFTDYRGKRVLAAVRGIPGTTLGLEAKIDADEAFMAFRRNVWIEGGAGVLLFLGIGGTMFGYRRLVWSGRLENRAAEFRSILESTPAGLVVVDDELRILFVNSRTEQLFGYCREELTGKPLDILMAEHHPIPDKGAILAGRSDEVEAMARRKDGSLFPAEFGFRLLAEGQPKQLNVAIRDVTERHQMQQHLERTKLQLETLFNSGYDAAFLHYLVDDPTAQHFALVNDMACERLGYTREELLRLSLRDIHAPDSLARLDYVGERLRSGEHCLFETEQIAKDGRTIPVEVMARPIEFGGRKAVLGVARDITERKSSLARLEASERRYRRYVERNAAAFLRNSLDGRVLECNDAMVRILGYDSQEDLKSHRITDVYQDPTAKPLGICSKNRALSTAANYT